MPMPARTLKTSLRFMLESFAHEGPKSLGPPGASQCLHEPELTGSFRNGLRRRWWAGICTTPGRRRARRRHTGWRREYFRTGRHCAPTTGARVAGVANGTVVQDVQAGERQATRWAHLDLRYRVRSGNMSRGSCYRARRRPPWIVSPLTRNSLAGAARSWPIIEAQSTRCSARQDFAPYCCFTDSAASASALVLFTVPSVWFSGE